MLFLIHHYLIIDFLKVPEGGTSLIKILRKTKIDPRAHVSSLLLHLRVNETSERHRDHKDKWAIDSKI